MSLQIRRVVTGHDEDGRAVVLFDGIADNLPSPRPGIEGVQLWTTDGFPANNNGPQDEAQRPSRITADNGTIFRVVSFAPGVAPRRHRTDSIDYVIVLSGEIDMELDGQTVHLKAGDFVVQRGTIHNWINRGTVPCVLALTLISAEPVKVAGVSLSAEG